MNKRAPFDSKARPSDLDSTGPASVCENLRQPNAVEAPADRIGSHVSDRQRLRSFAVDIRKSVLLG